ncbi:MAG: hypothetical protein K0R05_4728 [Anaerocolumna sp.]|nr:hypothetical protein [Anaerocolumna sp.]
MVYQSLSKIAPTLAMDYFSMDYQERLRFYGEIFNRSEKAEELIQSFENKVEEAKQTLADKGLSNMSVLCIQNRKEGVLSAFWLGRGAPLLYEQLELKVPDKLQETMKDHYDDGAVDLSFEVVFKTWLLQGLNTVIHLAVPGGCRCLQRYFLPYHISSLGIPAL